MSPLYAVNFRFYDIPWNRKTATFSMVFTSFHALCKIGAILNSWLPTKPIVSTEPEFYFLPLHCASDHSSGGASVDNCLCGRWAPKKSKVFLWDSLKEKWSEVLARVGFFPGFTTIAS